MSKRGQHVFLLLVLFGIFRVHGNNPFCERRNKCSNNQNLFIPTCYCDNQCLLYRDCCKEYVETHGKMNDLYSDLPASLTCELLTNQKYLHSERVGAFMVNKCKGGVSKCEVRNEDLKTMVPVSTENYTFRNADCAVCNNVTNFTYWNLVVLIDEKTEKELKTRQITTDETILNKIKNSDYLGLYYLHPPVAVTPRFCPYDVLTKDILAEDITYQNPYLCKNTWYRNEDECLDDGCCGMKDGACITYILNLFKSSGNIRSDSFKAFHLTLKFEPTRTDEGSVQEKTDGKVFFNDVFVYIVMELNDSDKGQLPVYDCAYSIIAYLGTTPYQLVPSSYFWSRQPDVQGRKVLLLLSRSMATLTLTTLSDLLQSQYNIECEKKEGNDTVYGKVQIVTKNEIEEIIRSQVRTEMDELQRFKISSVNVKEPCRNLSIVIDRRHRSQSWRIPVEASCSENELAVQLATDQGSCHYIDDLLHVVSIAILFDRVI